MMDERERWIRGRIDSRLPLDIRDLRYLLSQLDAERRMVEAITASRDSWHDLAGELAVERDTARAALAAEQQRSARLIELAYSQSRENNHCPIGMVMKETETAV